MRDSVQVNQFAKVFVDGDKDPVLSVRLFQQGPVTRIRAEIVGVDHAVTVVAEPFGETAACASVYDKPHGPFTEIASKVSPAMTVWA